jgi:hypothetical protein
MVDRRELNEVVEQRAGSPFLTVGAGMLLAAGVLHLVVTPMHLGEALAQGLFMATLGCVQVVAALWLYRRPTLLSFVFGVLTLVASIVIWLAVTFIAAPYGDGPETPEAIAYITKAVEVLALVALVLVPLAASAARTVLRPAATVLVIALLLGVVFGGATYGAGLVAQSVVPSLGQPVGDTMTPMSVNQPMSTSSTGGSSGGDNMAGMQANGTANATANGTAGANDTTQYNYSNCMVGMDMPGCPAAVAEQRYEQLKAQAKPDVTLPKVTINFDTQGQGQTGKATLDSGVQQLLVAVYVNDSGAGPYATVGPNGGTSDITLTLKGTNATDSKEMVLTGTGQWAGVDPAQPGSKGPFTGIVSVPSAGAWTLSVDGQGTNMHVEINLVERFTM